MIEDMIREIVRDEVKKLLVELEAEKVFNASEAAKYLRISRNWLYANMDKIPHADVGGYKFLKSDLDEWLKAKTIKKMKVNISPPMGKGCDYKVK